MTSSWYVGSGHVKVAGHLCFGYSLHGSGLGCWAVQSHETLLCCGSMCSSYKTSAAHMSVVSDALLLACFAGSQAAERHSANGSATQGEREELCSGSDNRRCCVTYWRQVDRKRRRAVSLPKNQEGQSQQGTGQHTFFSANASSGWEHQLWCGNDKTSRDKSKCSKWRWTRFSKWCYLGVIAVLVCDCVSV